jgi:hypothetical protein
MQGGGEYTINRSLYKINYFLSRFKYLNKILRPPLPRRRRCPRIIAVAIAFVVILPPRPLALYHAIVREDQRIDCRQRSHVDYRRRGLRRCRWRDIVDERR